LRRRQIPAKGGKFSRAIAANRGKFIAAFCRSLSPRFALKFSQTISLGDGVSPQSLIHASSNASFFLAV
jgi:hypothetical protein